VNKSIFLLKERIKHCREGPLVHFDLLALVSVDFDHLIVLRDFNFDILLDPDHSATSRHRDILNSLSISFFPVPPVVTRPASGT
jgi:hypothetical protein